MAVRKDGITYNGGLDFHRLDLWFECNGASNPVNFSPGVESVRRVSLDTTPGVTNGYLVKVKEAHPFQVKDQVIGLSSELWSVGDVYSLTQVFTQDITYSGGTPMLEGLEFGVACFFENSGTFPLTLFPSNSLLAENRVLINWTFDLGRC